MARTPVDFFAFGPKAKGPRPPRAGVDVFPDDDDAVGPEAPGSAYGASTFADVTQCSLTGHYFHLPAGTELPEGLEVIADGPDAIPESAHPRTHHTIYPSQRMAFQRFVALFMGLPWQHAGKKA